MSEQTMPAEVVGSSAELGVTVNRALFVPECQRLNEWALIGPVQRAALESFAERLLAAERERCSVLLIQRDSLRDALRKVLDAGNAEARARMSWQNARENFSSSSHEAKQHERAMLAASDAEREARVLLLTLKA